MSAERNVVVVDGDRQGWKGKKELQSGTGKHLGTGNHFDFDDSLTVGYISQDSRKFPPLICSLLHVNYTLIKPLQFY